MTVHRVSCLAVAAVMLGAGCAGTPALLPDAVVSESRDRVRETETAFARTMAARDSATFASFVAPDAVFLNGGRPLRGRQAILDHWGRFFRGADAPFSWTPDVVEVAGSGGLAQSEGPVFGPDGVLIARFYSTWRRDADGSWRIVFDNGYDVCSDAL